MPIQVDTSVKGKEYPPYTVTVERGRVKDFARATGDTNPFHLDDRVGAASEWGDIVAPPTFPITFRDENADTGVFLKDSGFVVRLRHFPLVGAGVGTLSAIVVATGPVATPFFLAYGLRRAAYIGTEGVCMTVLHFTRGAVFARYSLLTWDIVALGCVLGATMFVGAWIARGLLDRMSERVFLAIVEVLLVVMGLQFLLFPR